jgi:hypothetical protein
MDQDAVSYDRNISQMTLPKKFTLRSLDDLDGRTNTSKCARQLVTDLENDFGGHDQLSAGMHEMAERTALSGAMCRDFEVQWAEGQAINFGQYATLINAQRRCLLTLQHLRRQPHDAQDITPDDDEISAEYFAHVEETAP